MQHVIAGQANTVTYDVVNKTTGSPIITGTVTGYLVALTGDEAGRWWNASGVAYADTASSAGNMTFKGNSLWTLSIVSAAWAAGVVYAFYAVESGSLNVVYNDVFRCPDGSDATGDNQTTIIGHLNDIKDGSDGDFAGSESLHDIKATVIGVNQTDLTTSTTILKSG